MIEKNKSLSVFLLHFLERLNGCESIEKKNHGIIDGYLYFL